MKARLKKKGNSYFQIALIWNMGPKGGYRLSPLDLI